MVFLPIYAKSSFMALIGKGACPISRYLESPTNESTSRLAEEETTEDSVFDDFERGLSTTVYPIQVVLHLSNI